MKAVFVDIETTGLDFDMHVPIDIALIIVDLNDFTNSSAYTSCITCDARDWALSDVQSLIVNGYNPDNLIGKNDWEVGKEIEQFLVNHEIVKGKAIFICQNPAFDKPFFLQLISQERMNDLNMPYHWLDLASMYWIKFYGSFHPIPTPDCIIPELAYEVSLSKDSIAKRLGIAPEEKPHRALNGAMHLMKCYRAVTGYYGHYTPERSSE